MTYHKTWFSYVLWVIYTMLCAIFLIFAGNYVWVGYLQTGGLKISLADRTVQTVGFLMIPAMAILYWIIRTVALKIRKKVVWREKTRWIIEGIAVWCALALGIFLRVECASKYITGLNAAEGSIQNINGIEYFNMAAVTADGLVKPFAYGAAWLYVSCLSFVFTFLGNKVATAIIFHVVLQIIGMVLTYAVARKLAGRIPACVVLFYLACSPGYLEVVKNLGPECLYFVLYMSGMLTAASYVKGYCANRLSRGPMAAGAVAAGALIGVLGYLDLTAFTILAVMTAIVTGKKKRPEGVRVNHSLAVSCAAIITVIISCAAGFLGTVGIISGSRGTAFETEMRTWAALHIGNTRTFGFRPLYPYSMDMLLFVVLAVFAAFLVLEFFRSGREQDYMLWILLCIIVAPTPFAVIGIQPFGLLSMYIWGVLAGLGLQNCLYGGSARLLQTLIEEINQTVEETGIVERETKAEETAVTMQETADTAMETQEALDTAEASLETQKVLDTVEASLETQEALNIAATYPVTGDNKDKLPTAEDGTAAPESEAVTETGESVIGGGQSVSMEKSGRYTEADPAEQSMPKPRYLENPLPLPKKHVHRQMDYQYQVAERDMKFDVEIEEDDDFDL